MSVFSDFACVLYHIKTEMYIPIMRNISSFESTLFLACLYCFFSLFGVR